jgi:chemotaxis protein methyltransferase WspC
VVPETWFFRNQEAFDTLARLAADKRGVGCPGNALRALSIPCCTGEEPYSIVMALTDAGFRPEEFLVDAVDISERAIARARLAVYGNNSFRGHNLSFRERYFRPVSEGYAQRDSVSARVNFRRGNLLSADPSLERGPYDFIFCRNVLIYFDRPTQSQVIGKLGQLLTPAGYLFVGPAEAFLAASSGFTPANEAMSFAFRKAGAQEVVSRPRSFPASDAIPGRPKQRKAVPLRPPPIRNPALSRR